MSELLGGVFRSVGRRCRSAALAATWLLPLVLLPAAAASAQALALGGPVDFGAVSTGTSSPTFVITFFASTSTTITAVAAVTAGSLQRDYAVTSQSCTGALAPPQSCQVDVVFTPSAPGLRRGALLVTDSTGAVVNRLYLSGTGAGAQVVFGTTNIVDVTSVAATPSTFQTSAVVVNGAGDQIFNDVANSRIVLLSGSGTASTYSNAATSASSSLALSGDGTLFYSRPDLHAVYAVGPGGTATAVATGNVVLNQPTGLAVDAHGYLYIADAGAGTIVRVAPDGSGSTTLPLALGTPLNAPGSLAIDGTFLYVADTGNNRIVRVSLATDAAAVIATSVTVSMIGGLAVDAAGTVLAVNRGVPNIVAVPAAGSPYVLTVPAGALVAPQGIALQGNGDLVVADSYNGLVTLIRSTASYSFPTATTVGSADTTDGTKTVMVISSGTNAVQLATGAPAFSTGAYSATSGSTCPIVAANTAASAAQLPAGSECSYLVAFTPAAAGANAAKLTVSGPAVGAGGPGSGSVSFTGAGVANLSKLSINAGPTRIPIGSSVSVQIEAFLKGVRARGYLGTVTLTASDPAAVFASGASYTFTAADQGLHLFSIAAGVQFNTLGTFTITVSAGSITATSNPITVTAPAAISLASSGTTAMIYNALTFTGTLTGSNGAFALPVTLYDGTTEIGTGTVQNGSSTVTAVFSSPGTHTLTLAYPGDNLYSPATSNAVVVTVGDFTFAPAGGGSFTSVSVDPGSPATLNFIVTPSGAGTLLGPVTFAVQGLPAGAKATFSPATLAAGSGMTSVVLSIATSGITAHAISTPVRAGALVLLCALLLPLARSRRRLRPVLALLLLGGAAAGLSGCLSDSNSGYYQDSPQSYTFAVTASSGPLVHSAGVTLNLK